MSVSDAEVLSWLTVGGEELDPKDWVRYFKIEDLKAAQGLLVTRNTVRMAIRRGVLPGFRFLRRLYVYRAAAVAWVPAQHRSAVAMSLTVELPSGVRMDEDDPDAPLNPRLLHWRRHILVTWAAEYARGRRLKPHITKEELSPLWSADAIPDDYTPDPDRWKPRELTDPDVRGLVTGPR